MTDVYNAAHLMPNEARVVTEFDPPEDGLPPIWTIYDHPKDFPDCIVVHVFYGPKATDKINTFPNLEEARRYVLSRGAAHNMLRWPEDDPVIIESWI